MQTRRDETFRLVMTGAEKAILSTLAEREDRSQAAILRRLLRSEAEKRGLWPGTTRLEMPGAGQALQMQAR